MKFCPLCGGNIAAYLAAHSGGTHAPDATPPPTAKRYDQVVIWKDLVAVAKDRAAKGSLPTLPDLIEPAVAALLAASDPTVNVDGLKTTVHLVFDRQIVPQGGLLHQAMLADGKTPVRPEQLAAMGYLVLNGKVVQVDGVPVSPAYGVIEYWGGDKQFKRWHLARPVTQNPSRNGDPLFMDEEMIAFEAVWRDMSKIGEAMHNLLSTFTTGVGGSAAIANPLALLILQAQ